MTRVLWIEEESESVSGFQREVEEFFKERASNCEIVPAFTREKAWERLKEGGWDLVFLDLMLPNDDLELKSQLVNMVAGLQLLRRYHKEIEVKEARSFPVVVFTALLDPPTEEEVRAELRLDSKEDIYVEKIVKIEVFRAEFAKLWERVEGASNA